jgi:hypothetical protein
MEQWYKISHHKANLYLEIKIERTLFEEYSFSQQHYLEELLKNLKMQDCKPSTMSMSKREINTLTTGDMRGKKLNENGHVQIVDKLMYVMIGSRPDLAYSLSVLERYTASLNIYYMALAKQVLAYVKTIINYRLYYSKKSGKLTVILTGWVDSDYTNLNYRKSTTGLCFFVENTLVYWCFKRQVTIATSTTVAEYFAFYKVTTECVCLRNLMVDIDLPQTGSTLIRKDN